MSDPQAVKFSHDRRLVVDNLYQIKVILNRCIDEGMLDPDCHYYNELIDFIEEAVLVKSYPELLEVVSRAKPLEEEIDAWLALKGQSTLGLSWPDLSKNF